MIWLLVPVVLVVYLPSLLWHVGQLVALPYDLFDRFINNVFYNVKMVRAYRQFKKDLKNQTFEKILELPDNFRDFKRWLNG